MHFWKSVFRPSAFKKMVVRNIAKISDCSPTPYIVGVTNIQSGKMATLEVSKAFTFFLPYPFSRCVVECKGGNQKQGYETSP